MATMSLTAATGVQIELHQLSDRRPVDLVHLARFTLGNRELEREVLDLFVTQVPVYIADLKQAASDRAWKIAAHTIKGSARAVGAWELADSAAAAEGLAGQHSVLAREASVAALEAAFARAASFVRSLTVAA